ncbi:MAG: flagellar motor protein MotB [Planctomycetota bacterium]
MGKKKGHSEGHVNHERWLVSYADFITLLFAFFVVMYAISDLNSRKAKQVSQSVKFAMHFAGSGGTNEIGIFGGKSMDKTAPQSGGQVGSMEQWVRESTTVYEFLAKELKDELTKTEETSRKLDERGVVISLPARWLFETGSTRTTEKAEKYLKTMLEGAKKYHKDVMIAGLTSRVQFPAGSKFTDSTSLQLGRLATLERMVVDQLQFPADRVKVMSETNKKAAGGYASPAQVERAALIELIILR